MNSVSIGHDLDRQGIKQKPSLFQTERAQVRTHPAQNSRTFSSAFSISLTVALCSRSLDPSG